jgi:hypothetical protein
MYSSTGVVGVERVGTAEEDERTLCCTSFCSQVKSRPGKLATLEGGVEIEGDEEEEEADGESRLSWYMR